MEYLETKADESFENEKQFYLKWDSNSRGIYEDIKREGIIFYGTLTVIGFCAASLLYHLIK